jgi:hypothetical protein
MEAAPPTQQRQNPRRDSKFSLEGVMTFPRFSWPKTDRLYESSMSLRSDLPEFDESLQGPVGYCFRFLHPSLGAGKSVVAAVPTVRQDAGADRRARDGSFPGGANQPIDRLFREAVVGAVSGADAYISDFSSESERNRTFGIVASSEAW